MNVNKYGFSRRSRSKKRQAFKIGRSVRTLDDLIKEPPSKNESIRSISYQGGFSSISYINYVADREVIEELTASTLRVGKKQLRILDKLKDNGRTKKINFIIGGIMKENKSTGRDYDYYDDFINVCKRNGWQYEVVNNHSKILLMRTNGNHYVVETSSNLNENPKIEQFTFENDSDLYNFYYNVYNELLTKEGYYGSSKTTN